LLEAHAAKPQRLCRSTTPLQYFKGTPTLFHWVSAQAPRPDAGDPVVSIKLMMKTINHRNTIPAIAAENKNYGLARHDSGAKVEAL
jgi:hypothetical protein